MSQRRGSFKFEGSRFYLGWKKLPCCLSSLLDCEQRNGEIVQVCVAHCCAQVLTVLSPNASWLKVCKWTEKWWEGENKGEGSPWKSRLLHRLSHFEGAGMRVFPNLQLFRKWEEFHFSKLGEQSELYMNNGNYLVYGNWLCIPVRIPRPLFRKFAQYKNPLWSPSKRALLWNRHPVPAKTQLLWYSRDSFRRLTCDFSQAYLDSVVLRLKI
jgi:hypothetical protein